MRSSRTQASPTWTGGPCCGSSPDGYYQGAAYTGALHLLLAPTGKAMTGKWLGFGRDLKINTGDWQLRWVDEAAKQEQYHLAV